MKTISLKMIKESGKRKLFLIPHFLTFANVFFGFLAVIKTLEYEFMAAAFCIIFAVFMDFLDGKVARALHTASPLGMELDSLSDAISFCFAPVVLLYSWYLWPMGLFGVFVLAVYLCSGLFRLARFNVLSSKKTKNFFVGLPTTSAAFFIALFVLNSRWISSSPLYFLLHPFVLMAIVLLLSVLMVSAVPFPKVKRVRVSPLFLLFFGVIAVVSFSVALLGGFPLFFLGIFLYILGSVVSYFSAVIRSSF